MRTHSYQRLVYAAAFECIHCHDVITDLALSARNMTIEELDRLACAGSQTSNAAASTATGGSWASAAKPLSAHIPYAGVWEYYERYGILGLILHLTPPNHTKNWIDVQVSGTLAGPDIDNLVFTADSATQPTLHSYQSPWYNVGHPGAGGVVGGMYTIPPPWTASMPIASTGEARIEEPSGEVAEGNRHKCRCPRENFALNGAGCSCNGV